VSAQPPPLPITARRPGLVWVIFLFYILSSAWALLTSLLIQLGRYPVPPEQQAVLSNISSGARIFGLGLTILHVVAATYLWLLRRVALHLFLVSCVLGVASIVWQTLPGGAYHALLGQGRLMSAMIIFTVSVGVLINIAICLYVWRLHRRGVLK